MPRRSRLALLLALALGSALPPPPPARAQASGAVAGSPPPAALLRTAIVTTDREASRRFYAQGLGFRVRFDGDITRPGVIEQLGLVPGQTAWFVVLEGATSLHGRPVTGAMIGLLQVERPSPPALQRPAGAALTAGEAMLAIETDQFATIERQLRRLGAPFVVEPMTSADGREIEMVVRDPSGTRVHVVERRPAAQPAGRPSSRSGSR
jgi:catechol 2,3-dioxygenase-like lactoylglutathione lyase family enzyme